MVTRTLAILLATKLLTPDGRNICTLAIWLLQTQRLPANVLAPAKDRIAYSLRRAIEGKLGKEGKRAKGVWQRWHKGEIVHESLCSLHINFFLSRLYAILQCTNLHTCPHIHFPSNLSQLTWSSTRSTSTSLTCARWPGPRHFTNSTLICTLTALGHCCCDAHR
jgi:hypothetical protein